LLAIIAFRKSSHLSWCGCSTGLPGGKKEGEKIVCGRGDRKHEIKGGLFGLKANRLRRGRSHDIDRGGRKLPPLGLGGGEMLLVSVSFVPGKDAKS